MPVYHYLALNAEHESVAGQLEAESLAQAVARLDAQGLTLQYIGPNPADAPPRPEENAASGRRSPSERQTELERAVLQQHMEHVVERGRIILPALRAYQEEMPAGRRHRQLGRVIRILERGNAAEAVTTLGTLPGYWIPLLSAATSSRDPGRVLRQFLSETQRADELWRQWWLTLAYPLFLAGLAGVVMVGLSMLVLPIFRDIFAGFGIKLPYLTVVVFRVADWFSSGLAVLVLVAVVVVATALWYAGRLLPLRVRQWLGDHLGLWIGRTAAIARFAQFTADLLEAELGMPHALRLAGIATANAPGRRAAWRVAAELEAGRPFSEPRARWVLTPTILFAVRSDMPTAARIRLLGEISAAHASRGQLRWSWARGVVEPLAILLIGLVVGATVLALFLPLIGLMQGLA
jgi:type IV pilus assembly protein PilC